MGKRTPQSIDNVGVTFRALPAYILAIPTPGTVICRCPYCHGKHLMPAPRAQDEHHPAPCGAVGGIRLVAFKPQHLQQPRPAAPCRCCLLRPAEPDGALCAMCDALVEGVP